MGALDCLPASLRHAIYVAAGIILTGLIQWIQADYTNWGLPVQVSAAIGFIIPVALNWLTPWLTTQYGVGSSVVDGLAPDTEIVVTEEMAGH